MLTAFVSKCKVVDIRNPVVFAKAMSFADNCVLTLACREHADIILSDDRLLRRVAVREGVRVVGTLGVLIGAKNKSLLSTSNTGDLLDQLVEEHNFRISTHVYEATRKAILTVQSADTN